MGKIKKPGQSQQCRCCLKEFGLKELWTEYYNGDEREVYGEMVNDCFALPWEPQPSKSEHICEDCVSRLRDAVSFKKEILYADQLLNQHARNDSKHKVKQEEESDSEVETEYLSLEFMDDEDKDKSLLEIKIEQESKLEATVKEEDPCPSKRSKRYSEEDFKKCIEAVRSGKMSQTKAAYTYHVPRKTVSAAIANEENSPGPSKAMEKLNPKQSKTTDQSEMDQHRNNIIVVLQNTNATPFERQGEIAYTCYFCKIEYLNPRDLKRHTIETHNNDDYNEICKGKPLRYYLIKLDITDLICSICNEVIISPEELFDHLESHGKTIFRDVNNRIIPFRFDSDSHICTICAVEYNKFKPLRDHLNTHFRNYVCKFCDNGFITLGMLSSHEASHKTGVYACRYCDKKFNSEKNKKVHETVIHADFAKNAKRKTIQQEKNNVTNDPKGRRKQESKDDVSDESNDEITDTTISAGSSQKRARDKHRDNIFVVLENTNATPIGKCNDTGYGCQYCTTKYLNPRDLKDHTSKTHASADSLNICKRVDSYIVKLDITDLICKVCNSGVEPWDQLFNHLESHGKVIHRDIKNHIIPFKFDGDKLACAICPRGFNKFKLLRQHMNSHFSNYACNVCLSGFITERMLSAHMQGHKTGVFKCSFCEKSFNTHRNKKAHENMVHVHLNYASKCGFCKKKFKSYKQKNDHLSTVHGITRKEVSCSACNRSFESQTKLTNHVKRDHLLERLYKCNECDRAFFGKVDLARHLVKHSGLKKFECNVCMKAFFYRKSLREHMRIHLNDKRFKCDRCGMAFIQKWNWLGHMRRKHSMEIADLVTKEGQVQVQVSKSLGCKNF